MPAGSVESVRELLAREREGGRVQVQGWVRTARHSKEVSFLEVSDGSCFAGLQVVAGSALATLCTGCAYGFGAVFTLASGAQIPEGYDIQVDGTLDINSAVPVAHDTTWGSLKARY